MKKVLITGGTRGIGRALAEALVDQGCELMVCGQSRESVRAVQDTLGVRGIVCDVANPTDIARLESAVRGELSGLDALINNAGIQYDHDLTAGFDPAAADREIAVNLSGPIALTGAMLPLLMSSPAAVVANVTSALALAPSPRSPVYAATKAGLAAWTHALRAQLAGTSVRVVEIVPPLVATDMTAGRHRGAAAAEEVAAAIVAGLSEQRERILIGKARALALVHRLSPSLARRIMAGQ